MPLAARQPSRSAKRSFALSKWYLDVVADDGSAAIGYWANVSWGPLRAAYTSVLTSGADGSSTSLSSARRSDPPAFENRTLRWDVPRLRLSAQMHAVAPPAQHPLLQSRDGEVRWSCHLPRARAVFETPAGPIQGWGYAEHLALTIRPWRLPIDELRWGRCLTDAIGVTWLQWRGPEPRALILLDGAEATDPRIDAGGLAWRGGSLTLEPGRSLRRGLLGSTVLAGRPLLRALAPRAIRALDEDKSICRAEIAIDGRTPARGWAIHEIVRFRRS